MRTLYMIGAGSSKNYNQSRSPIEGLSVPTNADFFKMAKKVVDHYGLAWKFGPNAIIGLGHFVRNLNALYGYSGGEEDTESFLDNRLSLEEVMVHFSLEHDILDYNFFRTENSRTHALNELLAYTLAESLSGGVCRKHINFANRIVLDDVIWNFNYDILMDNAIRQVNKFSDSGYEMRFDSVYNGTNWERVDDTPSSIKMLKLHGSLNWLKCTNCGAKLLLRNMKDVPALWTGIKELNINCPICEATKYSGLERLIIPPSVKIFTDVEIRYLWKYASNIKNIEKIVSVGYSFSDADPQVKMLLREMKSHHSFVTDVPIEIVTRTKEGYCSIKKRMKKVFPNSRYTFVLPSDFFNVD